MRAKQASVKAALDAGVALCNGSEVGVMLVHDVMCSTVCTIDAETTLQQAAKLMADFEIGVLPVLGGQKSLRLSCPGRLPEW